MPPTVVFLLGLVSTVHHGETRPWQHPTAATFNTLATARNFADRQSKYSALLLTYLELCTPLPQSAGTSSQQ